MSPALPPGQLVTGAAGELGGKRETEGERHGGNRDSRHRSREEKHRERVLQNKNAFTLMRGH